MGQAVPIDDYEIQALVDDELDWERAKVVMNYLHYDPGLKKRYHALRKQKYLLQLLFKRKQLH